MNHKKTRQDYAIEGAMELQSVCYELEQQVYRALGNPRALWRGVTLIRDSLRAIQELCRAIAERNEAELQACKPWRQAAA